MAGGASIRVSLLVTLLFTSYILDSVERVASWQLDEKLRQQYEKQQYRPQIDRNIHMGNPFKKQPAPLQTEDMGQEDDVIWLAIEEDQDRPQIDRNIHIGDPFKKQPDPWWNSQIIQNGDPIKNQPDPQQNFQDIHIGDPIENQPDSPETENKSEQQNREQQFFGRFMLILSLALFGLAALLGGLIFSYCKWCRRSPSPQRKSGMPYSEAPTDPSAAVPPPCDPVVAV